VATCCLLLRHGDSFQNKIACFQCKDEEKVDEDFRLVCKEQTSGRAPTESDRFSLVIQWMRYLSNEQGESERRDPVGEAVQSKQVSSHIISGQGPAQRDNYPRLNQSKSELGSAIPRDLYFEPGSKNI
jgi:hypothetical protein